ncbi:hypothetical protein FACS189483_09620 [Spirochaetia bacterium]|nr:hypothetical protein FACS189483_09620 [Spirochaetia bacterium]
MVSLAFLAALLLTTCRIELVDSMALPPKLPYCTIVSSNDTTTGFSVHSFVLEWRWKSSILPYRAKDPKAEVKEIFAALEQALAKWREYTILIDPLPFYDKVGDGKALTTSNRDVLLDRGGQFLLDNSNPNTNGKIVIHRYWPKLTDTSGTPLDLDVPMWYALKATRAKAFKKVAAEIEGMMAAIEASRFYAEETFTVTDDVTGVETEKPNPLKALYDAMETCISWNPLLEDCVQLTEFDVSGNGTSVTLTSGTSGPLYEYYLGKVPYFEDYVDQTQNFSFPGTLP